MGLSNYQGTPMSIHYAKRKYDDTKLSKQEIDALVRKHGWGYVKKTLLWLPRKTKTKEK